MDEELKALIAAAKRDYEAEGFIVLGVFGSHARGDSNAGSDLERHAEIVNRCNASRAC